MSLVVAVLLTACGGGGGGGGGAGGTDAGVVPNVPLVYAGSTSVALVTTTNAARLADDLLGSGAATAGGAAAGVAITATPDAPQAEPVTQALRQLSRAIRIQNPQSAVRTAASVDHTDGCFVSGSRRTMGTLNGDGTGTVTMIMSSCREEKDSVSGQMNVRIDGFDQMRSAITDGTFTFTRLALRGATTSLDMTGTIREQSNFATLIRTTTYDVVQVNNLTGVVVMAKNLVSVETGTTGALQWDAKFTQALTGRQYDNIHGYVDVTTPTPFFFADYHDDFPQSGEALLTGSGNRTIRVTTLSATQIRVALDLDGNGATDNVAILRWTDLAGPIGADLGDTDGDGMHNSWESAMGLDPLNAADAATDSDGDGVSNLLEYQATTDPRSASSRPVVTGLSVTVTPR